MAKLSVIVPIYNVEIYLERSLNSLINQTFKDIEIILVNDGSTDASLDICRKYSVLDDRVKIIDKKNEGVSVARNIGIEASTSEYLVFMDPDDDIKINMYENLYSLIVKNECDICLCNYITVNNKNELICKLPYTSGKYTENQIRNLLVSMIGGEKLEDDVIMGSVWRGIYKKNIIKDYNIYFPINIRPMQDLIFMINYLSKCSNMYIDERAYYYYYINPNSGITGYKPNMWDNNNRVCNMLENIIIENKLETYIKQRLTNRWINSTLSSISNEVHIDNNDNIFNRIIRIKKILENPKLINKLKYLKYEEVRTIKKVVINLVKYKCSLILYIYYFIVKRIKNRE